MIDDAKIEFKSLTAPSLSFRQMTALWHRLHLKFNNEGELRRERYRGTPYEPSETEKAEIELYLTLTKRLTVESEPLPALSIKEPTRPPQPS